MKKLIFILLIMSIACSKDNELSKADAQSAKKIDIYAENSEAAHALVAHVHGVASMNIVFEGNHLEITFNIPAGDLVGFEHVAVSNADQEKVSDVLAKLKNINNVVIPSDAASCDFIKGTITTGLLNVSTEKVAHADVDIFYQWQCKEPSQFKSIAVPLLEYFPSLQMIHVNWIANNRQGANGLVKNNPVLHF